MKHADSAPVSAAIRGDGTPMLASIVITNYNYAHFLASAIESALAQTHPNKEIIVVDDGSADDSRKVIESFGPAVIAIYKENGGQGSAANAGFARSRGEVVIFLDADDRLLPAALEVAIANWEEGLAKIQYPMELVDHDGRMLGARYPHMLHDGDVSAIVKTWLDYASTPTSGNVFSRRALTQILPLDEASTRTGLDYRISCMAAFHGRVKTLHQPFAHYRLHMRPDALLANHQYKSPVEHLLRNASVRESLRGELVRLGYIDARQCHKLPPYEWRSRMVSLVSDPQAYPYKNDSRTVIAKAGTRAAIEWPGYKLAARIVLIVWLWTLALAPTPVARRVIRWGVVPASRPWAIRMLARLLETRRR